MIDGEVISTVSCIAPATLACSNCTRNITMGNSYLRVVFELADDHGELHESKRLLLCVFCRDEYKVIGG